ncbi:MAG: hypothetical protein M0T77_06425 [Actinomycetota bacterium]|nr:hypothetical protein [Actinomycetota bacterium]
MHRGAYGRVLMALAASVAITACGRSKPAVPPGPSALDPASQVPASVITYVAVTVRPQGALRTEIVHAIDALAGPHADKTLVSKLESGLHGDWPAVKHWLGQQVGVALTAWPASPLNHQQLKNDLLVVAPTSNPAAARSFLSTKLKGASMTGKVVGDYAIFGGPKAVGAALAVKPSDSLAASAGFRTAVAALGGGQLISVYTPLHQALAAILPTLGSGAAKLNTAALGPLLAKLAPGATAAVGLAAISDGFRVDLVSHGLPTGSSSATTGATALSSLPGGSWLALTLAGGLAQSGHLSQLAAVMRQLQAVIGTHAGAKASASAPLRFAEQDLLPALGPLSLAASGSSLATLKASLILTPLDPTAGAGLVRGIKQLAGVLPILAGTSAGRVILAFGYSSLPQVLHPATTLSSDPAFQHAVAQLPAGSKPVLFVSFAGLAQLATLGQGTKAAVVEHVLARLGYLVAGGTPTHVRLVLTAR